MIAEDGLAFLCLFGQRSTGLNAFRLVEFALFFLFFTFQLPFKI